MNREFDDKEDDDEIFDPDEEARAHVAQVGSIPSMLKAVIKFGYEDTLASTLDGEDFNAWIAGVFTHTQAHFRHAESLGTTIEFEVCTILKYRMVLILSSLVFHIYNIRQLGNMNLRKYCIPSNFIIIYLHTNTLFINRSIFMNLIHYSILMNKF